MSTRDEILARYESNVTKIRARRELNARARDVALARAFKSARDGLQTLANGEIESANTKRKAAEKKLLGTFDKLSGQDVLSQRDAADRAARIEDPAEALAQLNRCERSNDEHLAQAIAAHAAELALEPKWNAVVTTYAKSRPKAAEALKELQELPNYSDPTTRFRHVAQYAVVAPSEIGALGPHQIDALAESDLLPDSAA